MEMCLRITASKMEIFRKAMVIGEDFAKSLLDDIEPGFDDEDDDSLDLVIESVEQLNKYIGIFNDLSLEIVTSAKTDKYEFWYSVCNKKAARFSSQAKPRGTMRLSRENIISDTQQRIDEAVKILQGGEWDRTEYKGE